MYCSTRKTAVPQSCSHHSFFFLFNNLASLSRLRLDGLGRREDSLCSLLCSFESTRETKLSVDSIDTVGRVDVLDHGDLIASG
jgi:hypothetical protein